MTLKIPESFNGKNGEESYNKIINRDEVQKQKPKGSSIFNPINFTDIVKSDYVQIPNQNLVIAIAETNFNLDYKNAHITTLKQGLEIPKPMEFMAFHNYIIDCYKNKKPIFDAGANKLPDIVLHDLYKQLTEDCWTWLNGRFSISNKSKTIEYVSGLDSKGKLLTRTEDLEDCLMQDSYIDFTKLTKQGLPTQDSVYSNQNFVLGENIYFWSPENDSVVGFLVGSDGAVMDCDGDPSGQSSSLGVRAVKQGGK